MREVATLGTRWIAVSVGRGGGRERLSALKDAAVRLLLIHRHPDCLSLPHAGDRAQGAKLEFAPDVDSALARLWSEPEFAVVVLVIEAQADVADVAAARNRLVHDLDRMRRASAASQVVACVQRGCDHHLVRAAVDHGVAGVLEYSEGGVDPVAFDQHVSDAVLRYRRHSASRRVPQHSVFDQTGFVGQSPVMAALLHSATRAAEISDVPVLIYGETGTGKQLLAEAIHRLDPKRRGKRFQTINCAAIAGALAESALFGHVKGAFTGATENRQGYFRAADGGTVLLDEIGEMTLRLQAKLLRVLQEGMVLPVGSDDEFPVDVRVIAATNRRLDELVGKKRFRLDLYNRLNVITIDIPPIRERPEDIPPLVDHLLAKYQRYARRPVREIDPAIYDVFKRCALEGNVRELENVIRQTLAFKTGGDRMEVTDLPRNVLLKSRDGTRGNESLPVEVIRTLCHSIRRGKTTLPEFLSECERVFLATALDESAEHRRGDLAKQLGLSRRTLYNKRRRYGL